MSCKRPTVSISFLAIKPNFRLFFQSFFCRVVGPNRFIARPTYNSIYIIFTPAMRTYDLAIYIFLNSICGFHISSLFRLPNIIAKSEPTSYFSVNPGSMFCDECEEIASCSLFHTQTMHISHLKSAHFSAKRSALLSLELTTPQQTALRNHPSLYCAAQNRLLRKGASFVAQQNRHPRQNSEPPNLQVTKVKNFADFADFA